MEEVEVNTYTFQVSMNYGRSCTVEISDSRSDFHDL
jgi:hypothetical protein